jgi:hypothetical protein
MPARTIDIQGRVGKGVGLGRGMNECVELNEREERASFPGRQL